jgi:hypothetical protein
VLDSSRVTRRGAEPRRCRVADLDGDTVEADMTDDPNPEPVRDLSARADMAALLRDVPVVTSRTLLSPVCSRPTRNSTTS